MHRLLYRGKEPREFPVLSAERAFGERSFRSAKLNFAADCLPYRSINLQGTSEHPAASPVNE
jgi:hypothetical protein